jgi:hypothetical protein
VHPFRENPAALGPLAGLWVYGSNLNSRYRGRSHAVGGGCQHARPLTPDTERMTLADLLDLASFWEWNGPSCSFCHGWSGQRLTPDQHTHTSPSSPATRVNRNDHGTGHGFSPRDAPDPAGRRTQKHVRDHQTGRVRAGQLPDRLRAVGPGWHPCYCDCTPNFSWDAKHRVEAPQPDGSDTTRLHDLILEIEHRQGTACA